MKIMREYARRNKSSSKPRYITWNTIIFAERPTCMMHKWRQDYRNMVNDHATSHQIVGLQSLLKNAPNSTIHAH
jgi:hypothetical protein